MTMTVFIFSAFWPLWLHQPLSLSQKEDERSKSVTHFFLQPSPQPQPPTPTEMGAGKAGGLHTVTGLRSLFFITFKQSPPPTPPQPTCFTRLSKGIDTHSLFISQIAASAVCRRDKSGGKVARIHLSASL